MLNILFTIYHFFFPVKKEEKITLVNYPEYVPQDLDFKVEVAIDDYRVSQGTFGIFNWYGVLQDIAASHAQWMATNKVCSHMGFTTRQEQLAVRFPGCYVAEILAWGYHSATGIVQGWANSASHKKFMLKDWDRMACASAKDDQGVIYVCTLFIKYKK